MQGAVFLVDLSESRGPPRPEASIADAWRERFARAISVTLQWCAAGHAAVLRASKNNPDWKKYWWSGKYDAHTVSLKELCSLKRYAAPFAAGIVQQLEEGSQEFRNIVVSVLTSLLCVSESFASHIAQRLTHSDANVRRVSLSILGRLKGNARQFVVEIMAALEDEDYCVREGAVKVVGFMGEHATPHTWRCAQLLENDDWRIRHTAAGALGQLGQNAASHAEPLSRLLRDSNSSVRNAAAHALGRLGPGAAQPFIHEIANLLDDPVTDRAALEVMLQLENTAPFAAQFMNSLRRCSRNSVSPKTKYVAARALGRLGEDAALYAGEVVELLLDWVENWDSDYPLPSNGEGESELARFAETCSQMVPQIATRLTRKDRNVRAAATRILGKLGTTAAPFARDIANLLDDDHVRVFAATALGRMGKHGAPFAANIAGLLEGRRIGEYGEKSVSEALAGIGEEGLLELAKMLECDDTREPALRGLAHLGSRAARVTGQVVEQLKRYSSRRVLRKKIVLPEWSIQSVVQTLLRLDKHVVPFINEIAQHLKDDHAHLRRAAIQILGHLQHDGAIFASEVAVHLEDTDWRVRKAAIVALHKFAESDNLGVDAQRAVDMCFKPIKLLEDKHEKVTHRCIGGPLVLSRSRKTLRERHRQLLKSFGVLKARLCAGVRNRSSCRLGRCWRTVYTRSSPE